MQHGRELRGLPHTIVVSTDTRTASAVDQVGKISRSMSQIANSATKQTSLPRTASRRAFRSGTVSYFKDETLRHGTRVAPAALRAAAGRRRDRAERLGLEELEAPIGRVAQMFRALDIRSSGMFKGVLGYLIP